MTDDAGQILPMGPVQKAIRAQNKRITALDSMMDDLMALVNGLSKRLDDEHLFAMAIIEDMGAYYEAFLRHTHGTGLDVENAVNAKESRQERERHA